MCVCVYASQSFGHQVVIVYTDTCRGWNNALDLLELEL